MELFLAVVVPVGIVLACGGFRTAIRRSYRHSDYCLGIDLALAGFAAVVAYALELTKRFEAHHIEGEQYAKANLAVLAWIISGCVLLLFLLLMHQVFEERLKLIEQPKEDEPPPQWSFWGHPVLWLLAVANLAGIVYMAGFLLIVRTMP